MTGKHGLQLIEHYEGCYLQAYQCPAGVWTVGIGTTRYPFGEQVKEGDTLESRQQAVALMQGDLKRFELAVAKLVDVPLDQHEFDALVSLVYNIGVGAYKDSTLLKKINAGAGVDEIVLEWMRWNKAGGKVSQGLINRRKSEVHLYRHGELKFFN